MARKNFSTTLTLDGTERDYDCIAEISPAEPEVNIPGDFVEWVEVYDAAGNVVDLTDTQHDALVEGERDASRVESGRRGPRDGGV